MSIYFRIYHNLCQSRKQLKDSWVHGSNLHRHHITPVHSGGLDVEENYTYLTLREHQIAHFLLWKINRMLNDLRSMKMLGARLSSEQRKIIGQWCHQNKIGIFSQEYKDNKTKQKERCKKSAQTQKKMKVGTFSENGRKQLVSKAGKVSGFLQKQNKKNIHDPSNFKKHASLGGRAIKGMICVTNGSRRTRIKPEKLQEYIDNGYRKGFTLFS